LADLGRLKVLEVVQGAEEPIRHQGQEVALGAEDLLLVDAWFAGVLNAVAEIKVQQSC